MKILDSFLFGFLGCLMNYGFSKEFPSKPTPTKNHTVNETKNYIVASIIK
jgi:hypothetical protein